jgi:hypothetical protein
MRQTQNAGNQPARPALSKSCTKTADNEDYGSTTEFFGEKRYIYEKGRNIRAVFEW